MHRLPKQAFGLHQIWLIVVFLEGCGPVGVPRREAWQIERALEDQQIAKASHRLGGLKSCKAPVGLFTKKSRSHKNRPSYRGIAHARGIALQIAANIFQSPSLEFHIGDGVEEKRNVARGLHFSKIVRKKILTALLGVEAFVVEIQIGIADSNSLVVVLVGSHDGQRRDRSRS